MKNTENSLSAKTAIVLLFFVIFPIGYFVNNYESSGDITERILNSTCAIKVKIEFDNGTQKILIPEGETRGGGVFLDGKHLLTSGHLIKKIGEKILVPQNSFMDSKDDAVISSCYYNVIFKNVIYQAKPVGYSYDFDGAILYVPNIDPKIHDIFKPADLKKLSINDQVKVMGSPWNSEDSQIYWDTITEGVVSYKGRLLNRTIFGKYVQSYIQTDVHTSEGDSGGPAFDEKGRLIGILTYGDSSRTQFNFIVPIDLLMTLYGKKGEVRTPTLGFEALIENFPRSNIDPEDDITELQKLGVTDLNQEDLRRVSLSTTENCAIVNYIYPSEEKRTIFKKGDIILSLDGELVKSGMDIRIFLTKTEKKLGDKITIKFMRFEDTVSWTMEKEVVIIERPYDVIESQEKTKDRYLIKED